MGSVGAKKQSGTADNRQSFIDGLVNDITRDVDVYSEPSDLIDNGDIQGIVEAYAMTHPDVDEEELLRDIRNAVEAKINPLAKYDIPSADLTAHHANDIKAGDVLRDGIINEKDGKFDRTKWNFTELGGQDFLYDDITVTSVKVGPKTTKVTAKTSKGNTVTKTFKNSDIIQKRGKK